MKETRRRRLTVTSSLNEVSTGQLGNGAGRHNSARHNSFFLLDTYLFQDDVDGVSSTSDILLQGIKPMKS
jgi:hypothetical protein